MSVRPSHCLIAMAPILLAMALSGLEIFLTFTPAVFLTTKTKKGNNNTIFFPIFRLHEPEVRNSSSVPPCCVPHSVLCLQAMLHAAADDGLLVVILIRIVVESVSYTHLTLPTIYSV